LQLKKDGLCRKLCCSWWWTDKEWAEKADEYDQLLSHHWLIDVAWKVETESQ
jgi:hypothetical protein